MVHKDRKNMKNLLLLSALLLASANTFAQLYVAPNGGTDSYIYVDDEILFVEQDINLDENSVGATQASIYLRNQAQLIQGATVSANSGTGYISVYQDSNSDSYDYNFWCSPVGNPSLAGSGNVNFGVLRLYDPNTATQSDITLTTTNHNGITSPSLTISRRWLYMRTAGGGYQAIHNNYIVGAGFGFTMKGVGVSPAGGNPFADLINQNYDFRGRPNNGNISVPVLAGETTLSGNPYPSALDLNLVFNDTDNGEIQQFRFWDEDRSVNSHYYVDNKGGYGTWTPGVSPYVTGGVYTLPMFLNYDAAGNPSGGSTGSGQATERLFSPIGQGFNIYANIAGDGQIIIKNSHRAYITEGLANNSQFRNPISAGGTSIMGNTGNAPNPGNNPSGAELVDPNANYPPTLRMNVFFGESHFRDLVLVLWPESTDGYDRGLDSRHPMDGATADAFWPIGEDQDFDPYVAQTVPYTYGKQVPLNFVIDEATTVAINAYEEINLPTSVYLWDSATNVYQPISKENVANLTLHPGNYDGRYYIVFRDSLSREPLTSILITDITDSIGFFQNNPIAQLEISNPEGYDIKSAYIFDMAGKLILNQSNLGNSTHLTFPTATFADGVYIVKLTTSDNIEINYKITVFNK